MKAGRDYKKTLINRLKNPQEAEAFLNAALEDGDPRVFLIALRDVAEAQGGMSALARQCKIHRASLYHMTSKAGNPSLGNVMRLIQCIGMHLRIEKRVSPKAA